MQRDEDLATRLVVHRGVGGHCTYDEGAKHELIMLCRSGTVSVAKVALTYGINPNLLHKWIALAEKGSLSRSSAPVPEISVSAADPFIPVVTIPTPAARVEQRPLQMDITLANGIQAHLRHLSRDDVIALLPVLVGLPCSASTRR